MLRLAVATQAESYDRLETPLADREIEVVPLETSERTIPIGASPFPDVDVGYVFPPRLMEGGLADAALSVPWVNGREAVLRSRNKAGTLQRLSDADIPVPETVLISDPVDREDLIAAFERFDPPVVVKPNSASRGAGVTLARDLDSFLGIADYLDLLHDYRAADDRSFLLEEYVPDARDYRVMVLDGEHVGAVERRVPETADTERWKHNVHHGGTPTRVELDDDRRAIAERVADVLDIALLGVDLLVTDERVRVTETNARPTIDPEHYEDGFWDHLAATIRRAARQDDRR